MHPRIDSVKCIGCGTCVALAPEIFEMKDIHAAVIKTGDIESNMALVTEAIKSCPVVAITDLDKT